MASLTFSVTVAAPHVAPAGIVTAKLATAFAVCSAAIVP